MLVPNRHGNSGEYRYAFNGKEKDDELKGDALSYDYGQRIYDPRIGRWLKTDNLERFMPNITPYRFGLNNPLRFSDKDGDFEIDEATAKKYPKLNAYLKNLATEYANKPEAFRKAFAKYSELSDAQIKTMIQYKLVKDGTAVTENQVNPRIIVKPLPGLNGNTPSKVYDKDTKNIKLEKNTGTIELNEDMVKDFEQKETVSVFSEEVRLGAKILLESTLFHEGSHYGDVLKDNKTTQTGYTIVGGKVTFDTRHDPKNNKIEGGKAFEIDVYGMDIYSGNATSYAKSQLSAAPANTTTPAPQPAQIGPVQQNGTF